MDMSQKIENDCCDCETCVSCGRKSIKIIYCDRCGKHGDIDEHIYVVEGEELCFDCATENLHQMYCDDWDSERCSKCGGESETLYELNGDWFCYCCLHEELEENYKLEV